MAVSDTVFWGQVEEELLDDGYPRKVVDQLVAGWKSTYPAPLTEESRNKIDAAVDDLLDDDDEDDLDEDDFDEDDDELDEDDDDSR